jgi:hypothetical protein
VGLLFLGARLISVHGNVFHSLGGIDDDSVIGGRYVSSILPQIVHNQMDSSRRLAGKLVPSFSFRLISSSLESG